MDAPFGRMVTAMVTPFGADGGVDLDEARRLARHLVDHGSDGIVVAGTTGEAPTLDDEEKLALLEAVLDAVGDDARVIAGTGSNDTSHSVHLSREAARRGAHGLLIVTPYYNKPPAEGTFRHFAAVASAAPGVPIVAYNIPQRCVINMPPALISRLAEIDEVVAVKQATTDLGEARHIVEQTRLALYAGNDDLLLPFAELGGAGGICVASHVAGSEMRDIQVAVEEGDLERARALDASLHPLYEALSVTTNPIGVKTAMGLLGFAVGGLRLPLVEATEDEREIVRAELARRGLVVAA